jgi:hypothetical protein
VGWISTQQVSTGRIYPPDLGKTHIIKCLAEKTPISNACLVDWENIDAEMAKILIEAKTIGATPMLSSPGMNG